MKLKAQGATSSFGADTNIWILKNGYQRQYRLGEKIWGVGKGYRLRGPADLGWWVHYRRGKQLIYGGDKDIWVLQLTLTGAIQWQRTYGTNTIEDSAYSVRKTSDGEIYCGPAK